MRLGRCLADVWSVDLVDGGAGRLVFAFLLSIAFVPVWTGAATTPRWAIACVAIPLLIPRKGINFTAAHLFGLLFLCYAALSLAWTPNIWDGLDGLIKLVIIAEAFVLGSMVSNIRPIVIGFGLGMWVSSFILLFGIAVPFAGYTPAGLFVNSNSLGEIAGLVLAAAAAYRVWWLIPGILPALVLSQCRGAFLAVAGGFVCWVWGRSKLAAIALTAAALAFVALYGSSESIGYRLEMWGAVLPHMSLFGHGLGSFYTLYPPYSLFDTLPLRPRHLHNDWLEYIFETGAGAVFLFAFFWFSRSLVLVVLAIEACFGFPLHVAATAVLGGIVAGHTVRGRDILRFDFNAWRDSVRRWSSSAHAGCGNR